MPYTARGWQMQVGTELRPLRVAIIGSGPAAFFAAEGLLRAPGARVEVDMYERLPFPFGLVRYGVAPDHQKIKAVTERFSETAARPGFRFFGGVEFGTDVTLDDLEAHYHQVLFATGAQTDRRLGIPGEDLPGSIAATDFVAWYNGHPDHADDEYDLSCERAVVVGVGNVALDVARILSLSKEELWRSDAPRHVVNALADSKIREVVVLGRRGPAQASFSLPELKELGELQSAGVVVRACEAAVDPETAADLASGADSAARKRVGLLRAYAEPAPNRERQIALRFLCSPLALLPGGSGRVGAVRVGHNRLERAESGSLAAVPTGEEEIIEAGLVLRSVGYRGVALPGVPFDERAGVIPSRTGRVLMSAGGEPVRGLYATGWIKRGPTGVIGTNKPDAMETVRAMLADVDGAGMLAPCYPSGRAALAMVLARQPDAVSFEEWRVLDEAERAAGASTGRPREKFTSAEAARRALMPRQLAAA